MVSLIEAGENEKTALFNLFEKYFYEFSQWEKADVEDDGLYHYEWLDCYFTEENRFPYLIKVDGKLAGFVLISDYPEVPEEPTDFCLSEFFAQIQALRCRSAGGFPGSRQASRQVAAQMSPA